MKANNPESSTLASKGDKGRSFERRAGEPISWTATGDIDVPYRARVNGEDWLLRIHDFPDEHLYTLIINEREAESFDDWPSSWLRPADRQVPRDSAASGDDIHLSELIKSLRALGADSPERQARIEHIARSYAVSVYQAAEEKAARIIDEALRANKRTPGT